MSAIEAHAARRGRELDETAKELTDLTDLQDFLKSEFQKNGSGVTQVDLDAISEKVAAKEAELTQKTRELETALAAIGAKKKLEEELDQQINKDKDPKLDIKFGENLDKAGNNKKDLER